MINFFKVSSYSPGNWTDFASHSIFLFICLILLVVSIRINSVVEQKQNSELGQLDMMNYRPTAFLSLELETFWDRFSWFQVLIASLIMKCLCECFIVFVFITYKTIYSEIGSLQLIYPLLYNPTKPNDIPTKFHVIAITVSALNYLLTDFLPYVFLMRIIEVSLIKKR